MLPFTTPLMDMLTAQINQNRQQPPQQQQHHPQPQQQHHPQQSQPQPQFSRFNTDDVSPSLDTPRYVPPLFGGIPPSITAAATAAAAEPQLRPRVSSSAHTGAETDPYLRTRANNSVSEGEPRIDVFCNSFEYVLMADLPGVRRESLRVSVHGRALRIEACRAIPALLPPFQVCLTERPVSPRVSRQIMLHSDANLDEIEAHFADGLLYLRVKRGMFSTQQLERRSHIDVGLTSNGIPGTAAASFVHPSTGRGRGETTAAADYHADTSSRTGAALGIAADAHPPPVFSRGGRRSRGGRPPLTTSEMRTRGRTRNRTTRSGGTREEDQDANNDMT